MQRRKRLILFLSIQASVIWLFFLFHLPIISDIFFLRFENPKMTAFMEYKSFLRPFKKIEHQWIDLKKISPYLRKAVVIAEDERFYEHEGIDWDAMIDAAEVDIKRKRIVFGGSTISEQLVKNLYLSPSRDFIRKGRQIVLALILDFVLPKERILELYLNLAEWGPLVFGAEAASRYYFKKSAANLTPQEAAFLASILPNPERLGKRGFRWTRRAQYILSRING
jgi:monofunctional biosynthetic peptidoglycan transglycosylase